PVWYCDDCGAEICEEHDPTVCPKCGSKHIRQDEDVLDTWFSSALWPFSTLGYTDNKDDYKAFFPTSVLSCGYDIIFFWVARMIFSSLYNTGKAPFAHVLMHGIVRDEQGRKMSKSLGNGVDPVDFIDKYGADTLRFALINGVANGSDIRFSPDKIEGTRNFMNKIWNASRFVLMNCEGKQLIDITKCKLTLADKWILTKLNDTIAQVTDLIEKYELGMACQAVYDFVWSEFCDWYIELTKPVLYGTDDDARISTLSVLAYVLDNTLRLLHPFVPFITEKIYQNLPIQKCQSIMIAPFPTVNQKLNYANDYKLVEELKELIAKVRNVRSEYGVAPSKRIRMYVIANDKRIKECDTYFAKLCNIEEVVYGSAPQDEKTVKAVGTAATCEVPLGDLVDKDKEIERITKELENVTAEIARANGKLNNQGFLAKAPANLVEAEKAKLAKYIDLEQQLKSRLQELK
ncbi:MAG: class I tRNA ligase family protein, partial [Clostridia bacterium]|nr:class I tRNA ligase family protein [Clostridia bacterium]